MARRRCDGCGGAVPVAGGIADLWSGGSATGGLALEFADGSEHFLCFDCVDALPDEREPTAADVEGLAER